MTQAKHPPLYHALAALAAGAVAGGAAMDTEFLRSNPDVSLASDSQVPNFFIHTTLEDWPWQGGARAMHAGRLVSVLAGLILTLTTYALGRLIWPASLAIPVGAAAFVALLPESLFIGGSMSNDLLAAALAALAMLAGLWRSHRTAGSLSVRDLPAAVAAGSAMGLALLTKFSTVAVWPAVALAMLVQDLGPIRNAGWVDLRRALVRPVLASLALLVVAVPWFWRNLALYGDLLGMPLVRATVDQRLAPLGWADLLWLLRGWFLSFWGKFGGAGHLPLPAWQYALWAAILLGAAGGWLRLATVRTEWTPARRGALIVLWAAPVLTVLSIVSYSQVALGTDQGRLLFPALAPIALLIARGLAAWLPAEHEAQGLVGWTGLLGTAALAAPLAGLIGPFAVPPSPSATEAAQAAPVGALFGDRLRLVSAHTDDLAAGQIVLYWQAEGAIGADLRAALRLYDAGGAQLWEWKRSPAAGRFSTDHWPAGRLVTDVYAPPALAVAQAARVEVGVYTFPEGKWLGTTATDDGQPFVVLARPQP